MVKIAKEGFPFIGSALVLTFLSAISISLYLVLFFAALTVFFIYFFRDPDRISPAGNDVIVSAADGVVAHIQDLSEKDITHLDDIRRTPLLENFFKNGVVRISVFLSLFDVHVNRAPIQGQVRFLNYYPGKRYFTFLEKSSAYNQHNAIVLAGADQTCLIHQIVGPVTRRVVAWLKIGQAVKKGDRIGIMKFGSRLDLYFDKNEVEIKVRAGDRVRAGETIIAVKRK